jgi:hypothetical protein
MFLVSVQRELIHAARPEERVAGTEQVKPP